MASCLVASLLLGEAEAAADADPTPWPKRLHKKKHYYGRVHGGRFGVPFASVRRLRYLGKRSAEAEDED